MSATPVTAVEPRARARARELPVKAILATIVLLSTIVETLVARGHQTPSTFPDEYLYAALARSIAHGTLRVHGVAAHFPALLVPLLTAPMWLVHDVGTSYRLVQLENALVMSSASIPLYLIARKLGAGRGLGLGIAALGRVGVPMFFVPVLGTEPFAYPLVLVVVLVALDLIERPSLQRQLLLLALSAAVMFTRVQLAVLPLCIALTIVVVALRERRLRAALREHALVLGAAALVVAAVPFALTMGVGFYHHAMPQHSGLRQVFSTMAVESYVMAIAVGVAIVPAALVGFGLALAKPRTRAELAFGVLAVTVAAALLLETVFWSDVSMIHERYLCYLFPLLALGFVLRVSRWPRRKLPEVGVAAAIAAAASIVQLGGHAIDSLHKRSPVLKAFWRLALSEGSPAGTAAIFAVVVTVLALAGIAAAGWRRGPALVLALSAMTSSMLLFGAASLARSMNAASRANYLPSDARWVDHAVHGPATLVVLPGAGQGTALATLFWNDSLNRVVVFPRGLSPDRLHDPAVTIAATGVLRSEHRTLTTPLLVDRSVTTASFRNTTRIAGFGGEVLWQPHGAAALDATVEGRMPDGHLLPLGRMSVWAPSGRLAGWVELRMATPRSLRTSRVVLDGRIYRAARGTSRVLRFRVCAAGPWTSGFRADGAGASSGLRTPIVSVPRYVADPSACN